RRGGRRNAAPSTQPGVGVPGGVSRRQRLRGVPGAARRPDRHGSDRNQRGRSRGPARGQPRGERTIIAPIILRLGDALLAGGPLPDEDPTDGPESPEKGGETGLARDAAASGKPVLAQTLEHA